MKKFKSILIFIVCSFIFAENSMAFTCNECCKKDFVLERAIDKEKRIRGIRYLALQKELQNVRQQLYLKQITESEALIRVRDLKRQNNFDTDVTPLEVMKGISGNYNWRRATCECRYKGQSIGTSLALSCGGIGSS